MSVDKDTMMTDTMIDERAVIVEAQQGDRAAFGQLVSSYQKRAYAVAYGFVGNREDALELAQDSFVKAYRAMGRFDTDLPFYPWLYRIVKNTCLNHIKKRRRRGEMSLDGLRAAGLQFAEKTGGPERHAGLSELREHLEIALDQMTIDHAEIIRLRHIHELSYQEIAECLEIPKGTVMSRLHAARGSLREILSTTKEEPTES